MKKKSILATLKRFFGHKISVTKKPEEKIKEAIQITADYKDINIFVNTEFYSFPSHQKKKNQKKDQIFILGLRIPY